MSYELAAAGDVPPSVERLYIAADLTDHLMVTVGRLLNPLSPWAQRGTHGAYRWASFDLPEVLATELRPLAMAHEPSKAAGLDFEIALTRL